MSMREIYFYVSTAVFMVGFILLIILRVLFEEFTTVMYIVPIYLMVSGAAMAALVSCFEPRRDFVNPETLQLTSHENGERDAISERSSSPTV